MHDASQHYSGRRAQRFSAIRGQRSAGRVAMASVAHRSVLTVQHQRTSSHLLLRAIGTIDVLTAPILDRHIAAALWTALPPTLMIDLTSVDFLGSVGMQMLLDTHDLTPPETTLAVVATAHLTRILTAVGVTDTITVYPCVQDVLRD